MISKSHLISLSAVPGMGPRRIRALLIKYPELDDVATLSKSDMMQVNGISGELVFQQLNQNLIHIDALCIQLKKDTPEVLSTLLMLELKILSNSIRGNYLQNLSN